MLGMRVTPSTIGIITLHKEVEQSTIVMSSKVWESPERCDKTFHKHNKMNHKQVNLPVNFKSPEIINFIK